MPGEEIDFGPRAGDRLMVIGVAHDDVLNLRAAPGVGQVIVGRIPPDYHDLSAVGITRQLSRSFWILADYEGIQGWVSLRYVAHEGATDDQTARVVEMLGGYPTAASMSALGVIVAETYASEDPQSDVVKVVDETVGDLGEVTYDVIGIGDDASLGFRIHVFGEPIEGGFVLKAVELTDLCGRGVTDDGLCT